MKLGDRVSAETLARVDVVAFECNGFAPDTGNGRESCDWSFGDGTATVSLGWDGRAGAPRVRHVVANGSIAGADYKAYFGVPPSTPIPDDEVMSFLLFALPELRTDAAESRSRQRGARGPARARRMSMPWESSRGTETARRVHEFAQTRSQADGHCRTLPTKTREHASR